MSTRDELFAVLERAIVGKTSIVGAREATQAVINAGWRPPAREITTVEELEALPNNEERAIPQEAVEAAARVMKPRQFEPDYTPLGMWSDLEQMHEIAELDRDMTRDRVRDILTAALPAIEKEIRAQAAADIWEYWDACGDLIDNHNSARLAIDAVAARIAEGESE